MLLKLKVTEGSNAGKEIIINKDKFLIGRADDCNLRPNSDAISRRHCVIIKTDKAVGVRDLKSRNGTIVNGSKITGDKRLSNGDTLEVGPLKFEVVLQKPAAVEELKKPAPKTKPAPSGDVGGMVSQWLEEADDVAKEEKRMSFETREYRIDETSRIELDQAALDEAAKKKRLRWTLRKAKKTRRKRTTKKVDAEAETGKLPKFEVKKDKPKDTQEAAQQVLRKLFNRS